MVTALALHPAARRRLAAALPPAETHDTVLRPLGGGPAGGMIVSADEQAFIEAVLADLKRPDWRQALARRQGLRRGTDGVLELSQPIHRRFHLLLLEVVCRTPGSPRLDPRKIDGMGLVLRRERTGGWEGWMSDGPAKRGWLALNAPDLDPDPERLRRRTPGAAATIRDLIDARRDVAALAEQVLPLFVAPPEVCAALGKTVLYGLVPVASSEHSEVAPAAPNYTALPGPEGEAMRGHLSSYLKSRAGQPLPNAGAWLDPAWAPLHAAGTGDSDQARLFAFTVFLQQLLVELGAFEPTDTGRELMRLLGQVRLPTQKDAWGRVTAETTAAAFAAAAAPILVAGDPNTAGTRMPLEWPAVDTVLGAQISNAALACLAGRFAKLAPRTPKFQGDTRRYAVRGFLRVRGHDTCPARLVWSGCSEPFRVLPWWDGDGPPARIALPDISQLKKVKPNVSFELPPALANLLQGDMKKLKDGEGSTSGLDIFWLCSFSIPIITICAFIVLSIFLSLFDLIFRWMAWIKICIPIPRPK